MLELYRRIKFSRAFLALIRDPEKTEKVFAIAETFLNAKDHPTVRYLVDQAFSHPELAALYAEKYLPEKPDLQTLAKLPDGTLGREYARHLIENHLDPDFYPEIKPESPALYIGLRLRQTHDIWHVLTGLSTSVRDEIGLQAFMLGQIPSGVSASLVAAGILHALRRDPAGLVPMMDAIVEGYRRGKEARFLLGVPWERMWDHPLEELQRRFGTLHGVGVANAMDRRPSYETEREIPGSEIPRTKRRGAEEARRAQAEER